MPAGDVIPGSEVLWEGVSANETWEPMRHGTHVTETNVWGIDSFTRKNVDIVLREVEPREARLSNEERTVLLPEFYSPP